MALELELVTRARRGDRDAYGLLYDKYAGLVRALCFHTTGSLETAQDQAQEVFMRAYRRLPALRQPERFSAWLMGITRRVNQEWLRRQKRRERVRVGIPADALATPEGATQRTGGRLARALAQLPDHERLALTAFYLEGLSATDAQELMELSSSGFYKVLGQARDRLTKLIEQGE